VSKFVPSPQQAAIFTFIDEGKGSAFIEAVAGAGKTTTLVQACKRMKGTIAFAAFNKKIAVEIESKLRREMSERVGFGGDLRVGTFHSFGLSAWRKAYPKVKIDADLKQKTLIEKLGLPKNLQGFVPKLVSLLKQSAITPDDADDFVMQDIVDHHDMAFDLENPEALLPQAFDFARQYLHASFDMSHELIDFDDMIYLPVVTDVRVWQYDYVLVDEAQDTNTARRLLARKMLKPKGRALFVGDRHQAIYGFTGADATSVDIITSEFNCQQLPLTITYRCPKTVVAAAQEYVSHIQAHETAPDGIVRKTHENGFWSDTATPQNQSPDQGEWKNLRKEDAILCRNTKPLVQMAFALIRRKVPCHVEGRDIGAGLLKLANKYSARTIDDLRDKLEAFLERESQKLIAKGKEAQAEALSDRVETLFTLMDHCKTVGELRQTILDMFKDTEGGHKSTLTLSTVHKSKGREWPTVYVLGYDTYMPSKYARQDWQKEQENNLIYVAYTRAMNELVLVSSAQ
jgi:DNA helicase-2/ATP-dependent DNA helicase PcrA